MKGVRVLKKLFVLFIVLSISLIAFSEETGLERAKEYFNHFFNEEYEQALNMESDSIKSQFGETQMKAAYDNFMNNYGNIKKILNISQSEEGGMEVFTFYTEYEKGYLNIFVVLDDKNEVVQFVAQPASAPVKNDTEINFENISDEYFNAFFNENYEKATSFQDEIMDKNFGKSVMKQTFDSLVNQFGKVIKVLDREKTEQGEYIIFKYYTEFEKGYLYINVVLNNGGKISGFRYTVASSPDNEEKLPDYVDRSTFKESDITLEASPFKVNGKLTIPNNKESFPLVIMIAGSGPNDMNETIGPNAPFKDIALGLASKGIASIRFNKTTYQEPQLYLKEGNNLKNEYFLTAKVAYKFAKNVENADKIILLGHSEGGYLIPEIYGLTGDVDGLILLAANARKLAEVVLTQNEYIYKNTNSITEEQMNGIKEFYDKLINHELPATTSLGNNITAEYFYELDEYLPIPLLENVDIPVSISQGTEDFQVSIELDYGLFKKELDEKKNFSFKEYEDLSHIFNYAEPGKYHSVNDYYKQEFVSEEVIDYLSAWIKDI